MRALLLWLLLIVCIQVVHSFSIKVETNGDYSISSDGVQWFQSADYRLHFNNQWYSVAQKSLQFIGQRVSNGQDSLGSYTNISSSFKTADSSVAIFVTNVITYDTEPLVVFEQYFPQGSQQTSINNEDLPLSEFPSFSKNKDISLGYMHYYGYMGGWDWQSGIWPKHYEGGYEGGPLVFFDEDMNTTMVMSTMSYFTIGINALVEKHIARPNDDVLAFGVEGKVQSIPAGFNMKTILYAGSNGFNDALMKWGDALLQTYNKQRPTPDSIKPVVLDYIGYSTTGFYFYNPLDGDQNFGNYQETIMAVHNYNQRMKLPYKYYLIDSFWYGESYYNNSVYLWQDSEVLLKQRFPDGLQWLRDQLGVPFMAHMGKWSDTSPYIGNFSFIVEKNNGLSFPQSEEFWDYIMRNASGWGLVTLKQDHINEQILDMDTPLSGVDYIRNWLLQQGQGCTNHNISIMYCMDYATIFMESLEVGATATHSRASNDYVPSDHQRNWEIGVTGALLWSIGLYPYKDTFFSNSTEQVLHKNAKFYDFTEPYPITHALVSVLSAGPVAPSDGIGGANVTLINKICRTDGMILKPDRPAVAVDRTWLQRTFGTLTHFTSGEIGPKGEVWTTYTEITTGNPFATWNYIVGINILSDFNAVPSDLLIDTTGINLIAYSYNKHNLGTISTPVKFSASSPLLIRRGHDYGEFTYWIVCPETVPGAPILLGEVDKIAPVSRKRFTFIDAKVGDLQVTIIGAPNELVSFALVASITQLTVETYQCTIPSSGSTTFTYSTKMCS